MPKTKTLRKKKCRWCKEWFQPTSSLQVVCKPFPCAIKYAEEVKRKKAEKAHRERKKALKPLSHWHKETQKVFNQWVLLRDKMDSCISCEEWDVEEFHAGHYRSVGAAAHLRYHEDNVNKQCSRCNTHFSGNQEKYRKNLVYKIGLERVEALENDNSTKKWTREELEELREYYREKIRQLKREAA